MGIINIQLQNEALLLRWWWRLYQGGDSLWAVVCQMLYAKPSEEGGPAAWIKQGSFFWTALNSMKHIFHWCTSWDIGNGFRINFWYDSWAGSPILNQSDPVPDNPVLSLREAQPVLSNLAPSCIVNFTEEQDSLRWVWGSTGTYSSSSVYKIMAEGGRIIMHNLEVWTAKVPPSVRIFGYLLLRRRILTRDALRRRGINCDRHCVMCSSNWDETAVHLLFRCSYARRVWRIVESELGCKLVSANTVQGVVPTVRYIWEASRLAGGNTITSQVWMVRFLCTLWWIWRQRNNRIFRGEVVPPEMLAWKVLQEGAMWLKFC